MKRVFEVGEVGHWKFYQGEWPSTRELVYTFGPIDSDKMSHVWYNSIEHAMAAAIAERHTAPRGAGGPGVGTAADWFMKMIGAWTYDER